MMDLKETKDSNMIKDSDKISMLHCAESDSESDIEVENEQLGDENTLIDTPVKPVNQIKDLKKAKEKKKETLALIHQLHTHIVLLEKEKKSFLHNKRKQDGRVYCDLEELETTHNERRKKECTQIQENLGKVSSKISKFKRDKEEARKGTVQLEKLKILMEDIEENIMQFKEKQRMVYEDLMTDGKSLSVELNTFESKMNQWEKAPVTSLASKKQPMKEKKEVLKPKEVTQFENFLVSTGGHQGGWDDIDHQTFLKLRKQYKKNEALLSVCISDIPTRSEEDIEQHIQWYEEYCLLRERRRDAINLWKNLKEGEREEMLNNAVLDTSIAEAKRKKKEELLEQERKERLERLREHREKKQLESEEERKRKEFLDKQMKEKLKISNMMEEQKRLETKMELEEYKLKKKEEEEILRHAQQRKLMEEKQCVTEEERNRIKLRNEKMMTSKQQQKKMKDFENEEKERRLERLKQQVAPKVERDPNRLFKLTAGWERRNEDSSKSSPGVSGARLMPHRAVPSWRQGLS